MIKFTQKPAQISFCCRLKEQNGHKIWKKAIRNTEISNKQAQKQATRKSSKKPANP